MAKFKPVQAKKKKAGPATSGIPCIILLISGMVLLLLLFYAVVKSK
ncbi:MAG: hypothetical protein LLG20_14925 [Acidobacteriales bacterium]|nr:hypothetical protein [Terriglobales bacterium]